MRERQKEGITIALQKGIKFDCRKIEINDNFIVTYQEWKNTEITAVEAMKKVGMNSNTFYRRAKEYEYTFQKSTQS
ncbi:DNA recombinase [Bacillus cereus]|uniref:DNA recombinase n=1 Tax=Bacillus cereus TaxID=1396 RepID=A0AA44Q596_BACCE|nr:DNA recombinase [Bacillus cereus]PFR83264.1 DNA recombinase [Bacillus cereus]